MAHDVFFASPSQISEAEIIIEGEEFRHLAQVMRKKAGDAIQVVDGTGVMYDAVVRELSRSAARCGIAARRRGEGESGVALTLGVGLLKNPAKFDFMVEKATELGVRAIVPLVTRRTIAQHAHKGERWQKLTIAAMKQSGRSVLPFIAPATPLGAFLASAPGEALRLMAHEQAEEPLPGLLQRLAGYSAIWLVVGPEGGFTEEETGEATGAGFLLAGLGPRRLRAETAAIVATALCTMTGELRMKN